jgi:hypothetical protein
MTLTDYYKFAKLPQTKSVQRIDCTASTKSYPDFEALRNRAGELFVYLGNVPDHFRGEVKRRVDKIISNSKNISSIFELDITLPYGCGDVRGTQDGLLFVFGNNYKEVEVFVARGQKHHRNSLYNLLADGELQNEMEALRAKAITELVMPNKENTLPL